MKTLLDRPRHGGHVLLTGGTGYLGALLAAEMLRLGWATRIVIPTRRTSEPGLSPELAAELSAAGLDVEAAQSLITLVPWGGAETCTKQELQQLMTSFGIDTIVHSAGCLDYFNEGALEMVNVNFTRTLTQAASAAGVSYLAFVSTAYAAGYSGTTVPETLLGEPDRDPTAYTSTKRQAEHIVAQSGIPFLILRPSIVIGNASDGRYSGKRYGLYQQWMGVERLLTDRYHETLHTVATDQALNLLHQDAFQQAAGAALSWLPDNAVMNVVTDSSLAPNMKDLWIQLCEVTRPKQVVFYRSMDDVDLKAINLRQRAYLSFAQTNLEIGAYGWSFDRAWLQVLRAERALSFTDTTAATIRTCQDRFVENSALFRQYRSKFSAHLSADIAVLEPSDFVPTNAAA